MEEVGEVGLLLWELLLLLKLDIRSTTFAREAEVVALDTGWRGRELLRGGDVL